MVSTYKGWCSSVTLNILNCIAVTYYFDLIPSLLLKSKHHHFQATLTTTTINFQNICGNIRTTPVWRRIPFHFESLSMNTTLDSRPWRSSGPVRKCAVTYFIRPLWGTFLVASIQLQKIIKSVMINKPKLINLYIFNCILRFFYISESTRQISPCL